MSDTTPFPLNSARCSTLSDALGQALTELGIPVERDFRVPGTSLSVDFYLPRLPRAAVELKNLPSQAGLSTCVSQMEHIHHALREELGPTFRSILLVVAESWDDGNPILKAPDGIEVLVVSPSSSLEETAKEASLAIQRALDEDRSSKLGLTGTSLAAGIELAIPGLATIGVAVGAAMAAPVTAMLAPLSLLAGLVAKKYTALRTGVSGDLESHDDGKPKSSTPPTLGIPSLATPPSEEAVESIAAQAVSVMETFRELAPDSHRVLAHEMDYLVEEFRQGHFTACALRAGRSLEYMVYELSKQWGVELQDAAFGMLQELRARLDHIGDLVSEYQTSEGRQRDNLGGDLDKRLVELSQKTMEVALAIKARQPAKDLKDGLGTRTLQTLIKKIRHRYGRLDGVASHLNPLIGKGKDASGGGLVGRVLQIRNRAAHADVTGQQGETEEKAVSAMLEDMNAILLKLSNVGIAIQQAKVSKGGMPG